MTWGVIRCISRHRLDGEPTQLIYPATPHTSTALSSSSNQSMSYETGKFHPMPCHTKYASLLILSESCCINYSSCRRGSEGNVEFARQNTMIQTGTTLSLRVGDDGTE
eukprot:sb/3477553/